MEKQKIQTTKFYCVKHKLWHGQKYASCHPRKNQVIVAVSHREKTKIIEGDGALAMVLQLGKNEDDVHVDGEYRVQNQGHAVTLLKEIMLMLHSLKQGIVENAIKQFGEEAGLMEGKDKIRLRYKKEDGKK